MAATIESLQLQPLSHLLPMGSLILCIQILVYVVIANLMERFLLNIMWPDSWKRLQAPGEERRRRSFTYFNVGSLAFLLASAMTCYPAFDFLLGRSDLSASYFHPSQLGPASSGPTIGDALFIACNLHCAYYLYELCFRTSFASHIAIAHHIGLLAIGQTCLSLFSNWKENTDAPVDIYMCTIWGVFDIIVEFPIYASMVVWRVKQDNPRLLGILMHAISAWIAIAAATETVITIYLMSVSWDKWSLAFQVSIPFVFTLWIATQFYGAWRIHNMAVSKSAESRQLRLDLESRLSDPATSPRASAVSGKSETETEGKIGVTNTASAV